MKERYIFETHVLTETHIYKNKHTRTTKYTHVEKIALTLPDTFIIFTLKTPN